MNRPDADPIDLLAHLDPIDAEGLAADWSSDDTSEALLADLMATPAEEDWAAAAPVRRHRTWRRAILAGGTAAAGIAACLVIVGPPGSTPQASATCQLQDGKFVIDWMANPRGGRAVIDDLRDCGLDITITEESLASPSMVGTVFGHSPVGGPNDAHPNQLPPGIWIGEPGSPEAFTWIIDPKVFRTPLEASLYIATPPGEAYEASESVFSPGEPLAAARCSLPDPLTPTRAAELAASAGLSVLWTVETPTDYQSDGWVGMSRPSAAVPEGTVVQDTQVNDHTVAFTVRPPGDWPEVVLQTDRAYLARLQQTPDPFGWDVNQPRCS